MTAAEQDIHDEIQEQLSDYLEDELGAEDRKAVDAHLAECEACRTVRDELQEAIGALSGLHGKAAPTDFAEKVEKTIESRSAGRFFGRRAFGDRVPFGVLAIIALGLALVVYALMRSSETGSIGPLGGEEDPPEIHERARDSIPSL